jgi:cytosine/adenosine deaminase-related metal-dependent hydrolase
LSAAWVLPVDAPPIEAGAVLIDDGRIVQVGPDAAVPLPPSAERYHYPDAAIVPGLINSHTHLELTGFAGMNQATDFWEWIKQIIALKATRTDEDFFNAAVDGIEACWAAGVTTIYDMGNTGSVIAALDHLGASGIAAHEAFDMHTQDTDRVMHQFGRDLERLAHHATGRVTLGVSPHAPYTVSGALYRAVADLAVAHGVPIGVHVAEPQAETQLLDDFTGVFADGLRARGVERVAPASISPIAWLDQHRVLTPRTLCAHAIHTDLTDATLMYRRGVAVAHCPRSNWHHHHARAPMQQYVELGLRIGLGTDSEVSVSPLDLVAEAREARVLTGWSAADTLRALTLGGAEAVGRETECGSLTSGKRGDATVVGVAVDVDPVLAVLASRPADVRATWLAGRQVFAASPVA